MCSNRTLIKIMKRGLIQGSIAGGLALVIGLIVMLIYPPFTIDDAISTASGVAIGNFIVGIVLERWKFL
jgi:hypothetical protein